MNRHSRKALRDYQKHLRENHPEWNEYIPSK